MTARSRRPPAHQPTRQHAASAGRRRSSVSSTGSRARSGARCGRKRNAVSARRSFPHPRSVGAGPAASDILALQTLRVRDQRQVARALDRDAQLTLMAGAHAAEAAGQDLPVIGDEAAEGALVLVVDEADARLAEWAGLRWAAHGLLLVLVVVVAALLGERELLFGHRRGADFVLEDGDQVANHAVVQLDRALVLGKPGGLGVEARDDVVAVLLATDRVRQLAPAPVIDLHLPGGPEQVVEAGELLVDGGVFERRVEDIDRLVWTWHVLAILPLDVSAPRWLPKREEGNEARRRPAEGDARCGSP